MSAEGCAVGLASSLPAERAWGGGLRVWQRAGSGRAVRASRLWRGIGALTERACIDTLSGEPDAATTQERRCMLAACHVNLEPYGCLCGVAGAEGCPLPVMGGINSVTV